MQITEQTPATHKHSTPQSRLLEIQRGFDAPVEELFLAFATADAVKAWWWPRGIYTDRVDWDFREGGHYFINMKGFDQTEGGMIGNFEEIIKNRRIVMSDQFSNNEGRAISAKEARMEGIWPELIYITLEFESIGENQSRLILFQEGVPTEMQQDCIEGWSQSFDKLESSMQT